MGRLGQRFTTWLCLVGLLAGTAARGEVSDDAWARRELDKLVEDSALRWDYFRLTPIPRHLYQFECQTTDHESSPNRRSTTYVAEFRWYEAHASTLLSTDRLPLIHYYQSTGVFPCLSHEGKLCVLPADVNLDLGTLEKENLWPFRFDLKGNFQAIPRIGVDFQRLVRETRGNATKITGLPWCRTILISEANGSTATLRLTRERKPQQFPLTSLLLRSPQDTAFLFSCFYLRPAFCSVVASPDTCAGVNVPARRISRRFTKDTLGDKRLFEEVPKVEEGAALESSRELLKMAASPAASNPAVAKASRSLLALLMREDQFSVDEQTRLRRLLDAMQTKASGKSDESRKTALKELTALIASRVIGPARTERYQADRVPVYLAGHERWRVANLLEALAGPELTAVIYDRLRQVICDPKAGEELRLLCLDLAGELGVHPASRFLEDLQKSLPGEENLDLQAMLASVRVRAGTPERDGATRLRAILTKDTSPKWLRRVALEGLMLLDATAGQETLIAQVVNEASDDCRDYANRCLFAAGCCQEGRSVLRDIVLRREPARLFVPSLYLLQTSIRPGDPDWSRCRSAAKAIALEETQPIDVRIRAAQYVAADPQPDSFRDQFVRSVFRARNLRFFEEMAEIYLEPQAGSQRYAAEFAETLRSEDRLLRRAAAHALLVSLDRVLTADEHTRVVELIRQMQEDPDRDVRWFSLLLWEKHRRDNRYFGTEELTLGFVEMARREEDLLTFGHIIRILHRTLGHQLKLPEDPWKGQNLDEIRRMIGKYRKQMQERTDSWAYRDGKPPNANATPPNGPRWRIK